MFPLWTVNDKNMSKYNNIKKWQETALFENLLHENIINITGVNRLPLNRVLYLIFNVRQIPLCSTWTLNVFMLLFMATFTHCNLQVSLSNLLKVNPLELLFICKVHVTRHMTEGIICTCPWVERCHTQKFCALKRHLNLSTWSIATATSVPSTRTTLLGTLWSLLHYTIG